MGTKYPGNSISGYNSSPPADDGSVSESNKVKWATHKTKLADPVKTLAEAINTDLDTHFDNGPTAINTATTLNGTHYNQVIEASGTSEITLTDASTLTAGWFCDIINVGTGNIPIARATASNTIDEVSADATLYPLDSIRVTVNAGADGFMISNRNTRFNKGADVASASALAVTKDGNYFDVTGTTAITSINTVGVGAVIKLHFDGALTLTHHATDLILPGGANITTAAGDEAEFVEYASGDWRCTSYTKASGYPILEDNELTLLSSTSISSDATVDFTGLDGTYPAHLFLFEHVVPATDDDAFQCQMSVSATFQTGANDYGNVLKQWATNGASAAEDVTNVDDTQSEITLIETAGVGGAGSAAGEGLCGFVKLFDPSSTAQYKKILSEITFDNANSGIGRATCSGRYNTSGSAVDGIRFKFSTGNLESGNIYHYGIKGS